MASCKEFPLMSPIKRAVIAVAAFAFALAGCASSGPNGGGPLIAERTERLPAPDVLAAIPNAAEAEHRIGPSDVLEVAVFQVPDLSKTVQVNASGEIALPLIGVVAAGGRTIAELEAEIAGKLGERYLQSPQVSVFVKEAVSQRVTVEGAVKTPGMVTLNGPTTLLQTIALSGGLTEWADARGILVFRTVQRQRTAAKFDLADIRAGEAEDPLLHGGDVVVVDQSGFRSAMGSVRQNIPVFGLFSALLL
jgi:polysaccharide export outer membrane protein